MIKRIRTHHLSPLRPLGVGDLNGHRRTNRLTKTHTSQHTNLVLLELHTRATTIPKTTTRQRANNILRGDMNAAGNPSIMRQAPHHATRLLSANATCQLLFSRMQLVDYLNGMWYMICLPSLLCGLAISVEDIRSRRIPRAWIATGCTAQIIVNLIYALSINTLYLHCRQYSSPYCRPYCNARSLW